MNDLTSLFELLVVVKKSPCDDGDHNTGAEILTEASIFCGFGTQPLSTPVLDFFAEAVEVLFRREFATSFGSWLLVHDGNRKGRRSRREDRKMAAGQGRDGCRGGGLVCCC